MGVLPLPPAGLPVCFVHGEDSLFHILLSCFLTKKEYDRFLSARNTECSISTPNESCLFRCHLNNF